MTNPVKDMNEQAAVSTNKSVIPATTLETKAETNPVAYLIGALLLLISIIGYYISKLNSQIFVLSAKDQEKKSASIKTLGSISRQPEKNVRPDTAIANLCTEILTHNNTKVITFASLKKNEGKTFAASRIAASLASLDKKVLVIDMDLAEQELSAFFSVTPDLTLADATEGSCTLLQAISTTPLPGLDLISGGTFKHGIRSFLSWADRDSAFQQLKSFYDYVLIDTTDLNAGPDAIPFMKWSDMNLILHAGKTGRKELEQTIEELTEQKGVQNLFLVVNNPSTENKKPKMKVVSAPVKEKETEKVKTEISATSNTKPGFLKRVAMWFF